MGLNRSHPFRVMSELRRVVRSSDNHALTANHTFSESLRMVNIWVIIFTHDDSYRHVDITQKVINTFEIVAEKCTA